MRLLFVILLLFVVCMIAQCLLGVGDNLISALSSNLKSLWDISPLQLSAIYSVPYVVGLLVCLATGWLIPYISIRYIMVCSGALLFAGLLGMFGALQIGAQWIQIGVFVAARIVFQCGFFPMCICIDYIMSLCYNYYNTKKVAADAATPEPPPTARLPWYRRLVLYVYGMYASFSLSFGMIGAMQTYSDYGGKTIADLLLPLLSLDSLRVAMSSMVAVAVLLMLCIVAINYFTEMFHVRTNNAHRHSSSGGLDDEDAIDWADRARRYYIGFNKAIAVLTLLNFIWVGAWNAFLMAMPQIWESLFVLSAYEAPVHVGYGILASCVLGGAFSILPPARHTLHVFALLFAAIALPAFTGMMLPGTFHYPLALSIGVCCLGALMNIVVMMMIPFLFRNFDFAMVFVWLEFSRTIASILIPVAFGAILGVDHGAVLCVLFFGTLVAFGFCLYLLLMRMAIYNVKAVERVTIQPVDLPLDMLDEYDSGSDWTSDLSSTPRFDHI